MEMGRAKKEFDSESRPFGWRRWRENESIRRGKRNRDEVKTGKWGAGAMELLCELILVGGDCGEVEDVAEPLRFVESLEEVFASGHQFRVGAFHVKRFVRVVGFRRFIRRRRCR